MRRYTHVQNISTHRYALANSKMRFGSHLTTTYIATKHTQKLSNKLNLSQIQPLRNLTADRFLSYQHAMHVGLVQVIHNYLVVLFKSSSVT